MKSQLDEVSGELSVSKALSENSPINILMANLDLEITYANPSSIATLTTLEHLLAAKLPALCRVLFEPFCCEYPYDVAHWNLAERVSDILGDDRWNFRIAGPARLVFLLRAFHGLAYYLRGLGTPIFWQNPFFSCAGGLSGDMTDLQILPETTSKCDFNSMARHLKIRVVEDGRTKVELTQYASTIEHLDELLDEEVKRRIKEQNIDLKRIVSDLRRQGYIPTSVFRLTEGTRQIDVWLG